MRPLLETALAEVGRRALSLVDQAIYEIDRSSPALGEAVRWAALPVTLPVLVAAVLFSPEAGERFPNRRDDPWD